MRATLTEREVCEGSKSVLPAARGHRVERRDEQIIAGHATDICRRQLFTLSLKHYDGPGR